MDQALIHKNLEGLSDQELLQLDAQLGLQDLYHFNTNILKFGRDLPSGEFFQLPEGEIGAVARWLARPRPATLRPTARWKRCLILPRGTTKTSLVEGLCGQRLLRDPNTAVLWTSEEKKLANRVCNDLAERLASEAVELRYGRIRGDRDWTFEHFSSAQRTKPRKEPSFMTSGVDVPIQGWHFDLIICDDLQGLTNCTPDGIEKVAQYLNLLWPVLNPGGELIWICTRWDFDDVASRILKEWGTSPDVWDLPPTGRGYLGATAHPGDEKFFREFDPQNHEPVSQIVVDRPLFPSVLDEHTLSELRKDPPRGMGLYNYSCQIENNPLPSEGALFIPEDFRYVDDWRPGIELDFENIAAEDFFRSLDYYLAIDPASGDEEIKYGDDTTLSIIGIKGVNLQRQIYVVECSGGKWKPDEICSRLFTAAALWRPRYCGIEANAMQKTLKWVIEDRMRNEGLYLPLRELNRSKSGLNKGDAIKRLQPYYRAHQIFHFRSLKGGKLEEQLIRFKPGSRAHDDYPDSLAMAFELIEEGLQIGREKRRHGTRRAKQIRWRGGQHVGWY